MNLIKTFLFGVVVICFSLSAYGVPAYLSHQGRILDTEAQPLSGSADVTFRLYSSSTGGSALWTQTLTLTFDNGFYSVVLGPGTPDLSSDLFDGAELYLGVTLSGVDEFVPRSKLSSVPYAFRAGSVTGEVSAVGGLTVDGQEVINDSGSMSVAELTVEGRLEVGDGGAMVLPQSTLGDLPSASSGNRGQVVYTTDEGRIYYSNGSQWINLSEGGSGSSDLDVPVILSIEPSQIEPEQDYTLTVRGEGFAEGFLIRFDQSYISETEFVNSGEVTVATGSELTSGSYDLWFTNENGLQDVFRGGIIVDASPEWVTESGSLGFVVDAATGDHFTLECTEPEGQELTYTLVSGALAPGLSLDSGTGVISGDPDDVDDEQEYNFVIECSDTAPEPHRVGREFSLLVSDLIGQVADLPGDSCKDIMDRGSSIGDGDYWIKPGSGDAFQVRCDMTTNDGGWIELTPSNGPHGTGLWMISHSSSNNSGKCGWSNWMVSRSSGVGVVPSNGGYTNECQEFHTWEYLSGSFTITSDQIYEISQTITEDNFTLYATSCDDDGAGYNGGHWAAFKDHNDDDYHPEDCNSGSSDQRCDHVVTNSFETWPLPLTICGSINTGGGVYTGFDQETLLVR